MNEEVYPIAACNNLKDTVSGRTIQLNDVVDISGYIYLDPSGAKMLCAEKCVTVKQANNNI